VNFYAAILWTGNEHMNNLIRNVIIYLTGRSTELTAREGGVNESR
jgi:hypothetical protein